jgi:hypothetical protein
MGLLPYLFLNGKIMRVVPARAHMGATGAAGGTL